MENSGHDTSNDSATIEVSKDSATIEVCESDVGFFDVEGFVKEG